MRYAHVFLLLAGIAPLFLLLVSCGVTEDAGRYSSPKAAFHAYREALSKRDWAKCFSLLTPAAQDHAVVEMFIACATLDSTRSQTILKEYGLDEAAMSRRLEESIRAHDSEDGPRSERTGSIATGQNSDHEALRQAVLVLVKDKQAFYAAVRNLVESDAPVRPLGDLEELTIDGDTANGRAKKNLPYLSAEPGGPSREVASEYYQTFTFRYLNGSWLLDAR